MEFKENSVREWVQDDVIKIAHVISQDNVSDIFTKEIRDASHFCHLRDSFTRELGLFSQ